MTATLHFIGHITTPYLKIEDCPRNIEAEGPPCRIVVHPEFADGLLGLSPGRRILVLYWFEKANRTRLRQTSRKTGEFSGIFALRSPHRPNPIGAAVLKIEAIEDNALLVRGLDCLNNTPLIDIKPAVPAEYSAGRAKEGYWKQGEGERHSPLVP
jgi:tRNA-Thr(GGU) m(6)t(6)A37 methyltransferase TsaA